MQYKYKYIQIINGTLDWHGQQRCCYSGQRNGHSDPIPYMVTDVIILLGNLPNHVSICIYQVFNLLTDSHTDRVYYSSDYYNHTLHYDIHNIHNTTGYTVYTVYTLYVQIYFILYYIVYCIVYSVHCTVCRHVYGGIWCVDLLQSIWWYILTTANILVSWQWHNTGELAVGGGFALQCIYCTTVYSRYEMVVQ